MKWELLQNGDWQAKGKGGDFLLWKVGNRWTGRYSSNKGGKFFKLPYGSLKDLKAKCEDNYYWEEKTDERK